LFLCHPRLPPRPRLGLIEAGDLGSSLKLLLDPRVKPEDDSLEKKKFLDSRANQKIACFEAAIKS
jgi:hypothetical protein